MNRLALFILIFILNGAQAMAWQQPDRTIRISVVNEAGIPLSKATVQLLKTDSSLLKVQATDASGQTEFLAGPDEVYLLAVSYSGLQPKTMALTVLLSGPAVVEQQIQLIPQPAELGNVIVSSRKPFVQFAPDKVVVNVDAGIGNAGSSIMDVLEKSPGITVGRDGNISMKGKPQVMVLIDGKPTQLTGADLQAYLSGISASQVDVIELIDTPGAKYDAAGNAGIINIKTKKLKQKGFNGSLGLGIGQGFYFKSNNSLNLNYRNGRVNVFLNYGNRLATEMMEMFALRKYFDQAGRDSLYLSQPNFTKTRINAHNIKAGIDLFASERTTLGFTFTGNYNDRYVNSYSTIDWKNPANVTDSTINTWGTRDNLFKRAGWNLSARHQFTGKDELSADLDWIRFNIDGGQFFQTQLSSPGAMIQATRGNIPSTLEILTAKIDYSKKWTKLQWEAGLKSALTKTDNLAEYSFNNGQVWTADLSRSNHFLYDEQIHAMYSSLGADNGKLQWQAGLRYELTQYKANQLGNAVVKDSAFSRNYGSLFPTLFLSYKADSNNTFSFRAGRRIDRPQFQALNPFIITINKYTFEGGNPFIRPQFTWNFEVQHFFKQILSTGISYSYLKDYFSQIFIIDSNSSNVNKNIIIYTRGNVGSFQSIGANMTLQLPVTKWWNLTGTAVYTYKIIKGVVWAPLEARIHQLNVSLNNQFQLGKGWAAEVSGYYQTNSQVDLQESLTPQGEMGFGISKQIWKNRATLRMNVRDIFYTQNYSGYSNFQNADEPFEIKWDSRVVRLSLAWRFGKAMKAIKRSQGGATEEAERAGTGN